MNKTAEQSHQTTRQAVPTTALVMWECPGCGYTIGDAVMRHGGDDYPCSCGYFTFGDFNETERPRKTYPKVPEVGKCETIDGVRHVEIKP